MAGVGLVTVSERKSMSMIFVVSGYSHKSSFFAGKIPVITHFYHEY